MHWIVQDAIVTALALGAAAVLVRRVVRMVRPSGPAHACASCPTSCAPAPAARESAEARVPVTVLRLGRGLATESRRAGATKAD